MYEIKGHCTLAGEKFLLRKITFSKFDECQLKRIIREVLKGVRDLRNNEY